MFTDGVGRQLQLQIKWSLSYKLSLFIANKYLQPWNLFFPESYYTAALFSSSCCSHPVSPHPYLSYPKWCQQRTLERERFISKWLPKTQSHLYVDEINIDVLPPSCRVLPNWCQPSCITSARYVYWQEACLVIWLVTDKTKPEQVLKVSRQTDSATQSPETKQTNEVKWHTDEREREWERLAEMIHGWVGVWRILIIKAEPSCMDKALHK